MPLRTSACSACCDVVLAVSMCTHAVGRREPRSSELLSSCSICCNCCARRSSSDASAAVAGCEGEVGVEVAESNGMFTARVSFGDGVAADEPAGGAAIRLLLLLPLAAAAAAAALPSSPCANACRICSESDPLLEILSRRREEGVAGVGSFTPGGASRATLEQPRVRRRP